MKAVGTTTLGMLAVLCFSLPWEYINPGESGSETQGQQDLNSAMLVEDRQDDLIEVIDLRRDYHNKPESHSINEVLSPRNIFESILTQPEVICFCNYYARKDNCNTAVGFVSIEGAGRDIKTGIVRVTPTVLLYFDRKKFVR